MLMDWKWLKVVYNESESATGASVVVGHEIAENLFKTKPIEKLLGCMVKINSDWCVKKEVNF